MMRVLVAIAIGWLSLVPAISRAEQAEQEDESGTASKPPADEDASPSAAPAGSSAEPGSTEATSDSAQPENGVAQGRMTLPGGGFVLGIVVETNVATGKIAKPISVAPDLWFGLHDRLTAGIYHSGRATTGFLSSYGSGLCFRDGMSGICKAGLSDLYTFLGGEVRIGLSQGRLATALVLGGTARFADPNKLFAAKAGLLARVHFQRIGVEISPVALIGLNMRKVMDVAVNEDFLFVPVTFYVRFAPGVSLALQTGLATTFKNAADNYKVPAAVGLSFWLGEHVSIDAAFGLAAVADKDSATKPLDQRSVTVGLSYAK